MATINYSTQFSTTEPSDTNSEHLSKPIDPDMPMNILFIADMAGTKDTPSAINIDRDNFEEIMSQLDIKVELDLNTSEVFNIPISELEDFEPDSLFEKLEIFQRLKKIRQQLQNSSTFQQAASEIQGWLVETPVNDQEKTQTPVTDETTDSANLLESILDSSPNTSTAQSSTSLADQLIKEIVRPYIIEASDPNKDNYIDAVDKAISQQMRSILHNKKFQQVESAWRDLYFLIRRLETGSHLKLFLIDAKKDESVLKLNTIYQNQPDFPWALLLSHYTFRLETTDIKTITDLGIIAQKCNAPVVAAADTSFVGVTNFSENTEYDEWPEELDTSLEQDWNALRSSKLANFIALTSPRFLLRYPYGKKSSPVNNFSFEEFAAEPEHENFLWGNAATLITFMIASSYSKDKWQLNINESNRIAGMPSYYYEHENEQVLKPCAEINLTSRGGEIITSRGLIPVFSVRNEDAVQLGKICSIGSERELKGRWV